MEIKECDRKNTDRPRGKQNPVSHGSAKFSKLHGESVKVGSPEREGVLLYLLTSIGTNLQRSGDEGGVKGSQSKFQGS